MKGMIRKAFSLCLSVGLVAFAAAAAHAVCPMGGTMLKIDIDRDKAAAWLEGDRRAFVLNEDEWSITTLSATTDKIALVITAEGVFFGVADDRDDREVDDKRMNKAFGNDLKYLSETVQKEVNAMWKAQVIDIRGGDVSKISDAVGLGTVSQESGDWALETQDCQGMTVNVEGID